VTLSATASGLARDLFALGHWSRDDELRILGQTDDDVYLTGWMEGIHEHHGITWFETIQQASRPMLEDADVRNELAEYVAHGVGDAFRRRSATLGAAGMVSAIQGEGRDTSEMADEEKASCWTLGSWTHLAYTALSPEAHVALEADCAP
jgi:hypothetical protein